MEHAEIQRLAVEGPGFLASLFKEEVELGEAHLVGEGRGDAAAVCEVKTIEGCRTSDRVEVWFRDERLDLGEPGGGDAGDEGYAGTLTVCVRDRPNDRDLYRTVEFQDDAPGGARYETCPRLGGEGVSLRELAIEAFTHADWNSGCEAGLPVNDTAEARDAAARALGPADPDIDPDVTAGVREALEGRHVAVAQIPRENLDALDGLEDYSEALDAIGARKAVYKPLWESTWSTWEILPDTSRGCADMAYVSSGWATWPAAMAHLVAPAAVAESWELREWDRAVARTCAEPLDVVFPDLDNWARLALCGAEPPVDAGIDGPRRVGPPRQAQALADTARMARAAGGAGPDGPVTKRL